jgi:5'(3')-deoxyribonucleotidase
MLKINLQKKRKKLKWLRRKFQLLNLSNLLLKMRKNLQKKSNLLLLMSKLLKKR